jgi:hypothetical protein
LGLKENLRNEDVNKVENFSQGNSAEENGIKNLNDIKYKDDYYSTLVNIIAKNSNENLNGINIPEENNNKIEINQKGIEIINNKTLVF